MANGDSDNVSVLLGNGDGTFQAAVNYGAGDILIQSPSGILMEMATWTWPWRMSSSDDVSVLLGNGDGTFQAAVNYGAGDGP